MMRQLPGDPRWIDEIPAVQAALRPDAPALAQGDVRWSYAQWEAAVATACEALADEGLRAGDRMMIVGENGLVVATLIHAVARVRAWPMVVNARLSAREIDAIAAHAEPRLIACASDVSPDAAAHAARLGANPVAWGSLPPFALTPTRKAMTEPVEDDPKRQVGALIYTSGTTGAPKGVMLSHASVLHVAKHSGRLRRLAPGERVYGALPVSHIFGLASVFLGTVYYGSFLALVPRFEPAAALAMLRDEKLTVFQGVPAMFAKMLEHAEATGSAIEAPALRYMSSGGAPLDLALKREVERRFGAVLHNGYGMTELSPTVTLTLIDAPRQDDSVGQVLPGVTIRIAHDDGRTKMDGEIGRLQVSGPTVMLGYYRAPEETAKIVRDGWLDTGDLARRDPDGAVFIVGRAKDVIIRSGFNVYPEEVEAVLTSHPDVTLAAVVGRPVVSNEEVIAFVQPRPGSALDAATLAAWAAERLAPYKRPARIVLSDALPAAATGKILKHRLRERAAALDTTS
jgi:acyl-CoA synthetase (AMP-forming)/AMP-acid ligase II